MNLAYNDSFMLNAEDGGHPSCLSLSQVSRSVPFYSTVEHKSLGILVVMLTFRNNLMGFFTYPLGDAVFS